MDKIWDFKIAKLKIWVLDIPEPKPQSQNSNNNRNQEMSLSPPHQRRRRNNILSSTNFNSKILEAFKNFKFRKLRH